MFLISITHKETPDSQFSRLFYVLTTEHEHEKGKTGKIQLRKRSLE